MENRDKTHDRAGCLFEILRPELIKVLRNAPEYGSCGIDIVLHQGEITRIVVRSEIMQKLQPRTGGVQ